MLRPAALAVLALSLAACAQPTFLDGVVPSEVGFDGAVTVTKVEYDDDFGIVTVEVPYLDVHGKPKSGEGRIVVRKEDIETGAKLPLFAHVHYEKDVGGAKKWCKRGWAVSTAHYEKYPIDVSAGDGNNLARAIIEWARRLPFIDRSRLHIDGGSQGGYMALAMSADFFPVTATTADAPVVNWAYNLGYFEANKAASRYPQEDIANSPLPVVCAVTMLADWAYGVFGNDLADDKWYVMSPVSQVDRIANPVHVVCATGDMLVPLEQMTSHNIPAIDPARFPPGYTRDFDTLTRCEAARKRFEDVLPEGSYKVDILPLQEKAFELTLDMFQNKVKKPKERPDDIERPWSKDHQWSLCYLDEGPPTPYAAHTSFEWSTSPDGFVEFYRKQPPAPDILNGPKLERLMQRYAGKLEQVPTLADGTPCNRLNYLLPERLDVVQGLLDYAAMGPEHKERLNALLKPFGDVPSIEEFGQELENLRNQMKP